jgi:glycosyltransferase 2 family protein
MKKIRFIQIVATLITIILVAFLFTQVSIKDVIATLLSIKPAFLIAGFILYTGSYFFRAWRFHILLNKEVSIKDLFHIECIHNMMNNVLPARTGEISYVYLLKKVNSRTTGEGLATLMVARIFDFIIISALFILSLFINRDSSSGLMKYLWICVSFLIIMMILIALLILSGNWTIRQIKLFFELFHIKTTSIGQFIIDKSEETILCISRISKDKTTTFRILGFIFILSIFIWITIYTMTFFLIYAMGFKLSYSIVLLGSTFAILSSVLPVQGIGGFGTTEGAWVVGFVLLGISRDDAISSGFGYHIIVLVFTILIGMIGLFFLKKGIISNLFTMNQV